MKTPIPYQPSAFYFRQELRATQTREVAVEIGMVLVLELELHKQWIRERGLVPPKWHIMPSERAAKAWAEVIPFPTTTASSATGA